MFPMSFFFPGQFMDGTHLITLLVPQNTGDEESLPQNRGDLDPIASWPGEDH